MERVWQHDRGIWKTLPGSCQGKAVAQAGGSWDVEGTPDKQSHFGFSVGRRKEVLTPLLNWAVQEFCGSHEASQVSVHGCLLRKGGSKRISLFFLWRRQASKILVSSLSTVWALFWSSPPSKSKEVDPKHLNLSLIQSHPACYLQHWLRGLIWGSSYFSFEWHMFSKTCSAFLQVLVQ